MSRWKPLPEELDPGVRQLVVRLRRLKDHSGLSLRQLAAKTGYSAKSWERYLGGRSLPPVEAVRALAGIAGEDPVRLLALHEVAVEGWTRDRTDPPAPRPRTAEGPRSPGRALRIALVAGASALVLAVSAALLVAIRLDGDGDGDGGGTEATPAAPPALSAPPVSGSGTTPVPPYTCRLERTDGRWYAGLSRTLDLNLAQGNAGPDVAEAQCLLRRKGISPGAVDGIFGPRTQRAVEEIQRRAGLVVDGIIGPHTWKAMRG
ncbi:peptidoglycan-binding protein [Streptomyces sp. NPDC047072]|uniref:peptidoglycan-binding protein n=1 Tax=Streptomyces sp. NPDC047072 TaxID=3154809 RepID=UPI00340FC52C